MRYRRRSYDRTTTLVDRQITSLDDLANVLINAGEDDWIEGLGEPTCHRDLITWGVIGEFLVKVAGTYGITGQGWEAAG